MAVKDLVDIASRVAFNGGDDRARDFFVARLSSYNITIFTAYLSLQYDNKRCGK